jgi:hypothetical protein
MLRGVFVSITVWNKWRNPSTNKDEWFRHVIPNCAPLQNTVRTVMGTTASLATTTGVMVNENSLYKTSDEWAAGDKTAFFTLQAGDLVAIGEHAIEITGASPYRESDIRQSLGGKAFVIKIFQDNAAAQKRGRHYYIEGA